MDHTTASPIAPLQSRPGRAARAGRVAVLLLLPALTAPPAIGLGRSPAAGNPDPAREAWHVDVPAYRVLGSGHPGSRRSDISPPDGLEFTPSGVLLTTDAGNRRVKIWDVRTGDLLGEFGSNLFGGEITNVTAAPDGTIYVADSRLNLVYVFAPKAAKDGQPRAKGPDGYEFAGTRFGDAGFKKLGGMAVDAKNRLYIADGKRWEVRRFLPDGSPDPTWKFTRTLPDGDTVLHRCEGMEIDTARSLLFVASEADHVVKVFDLETGAFTKRLIGARPDGAGRPTGTSVSESPIEGLAVVQGFLLATDEMAGHVNVYDLSNDTVFDNDLAAYGAARAKGTSAFLGFFGKPPAVNFDVDDTPNPDLAMRARVDAGEVTPGLVNAVGEFCSPDEIAAWTDTATGESYVAVADQCNFRVVVYRWSDIKRGLRDGARAMAK